MAEEENNSDENEGEGGAAKSGGKKKLILLVLLLIVIVGLSVGGTLLAIKFLGPQEVEAPPEDMVEEEPPPKPAIYYPIKPPITVNFSVKGRQRYLQAELTLMTREDDVISAIELHLPMLKNALVLLIGGQDYREIQTAEGKELLRQQCLQEIQRLLEQEIGKPGIEQVLFTNFVMQ